MSTVSTAQYVAAMKRQRALTDPQWLQRCGELAQQQPTMFFELLTFLRDGVPPNAGRKLIDYLSALQFASRAVSESVSAPVLEPEFKAAVLRTMQFFHAISTDDRPHFDRMMKAWDEGMVERGEPVVWAACFEILHKPEIMDHPLFSFMGIALSAVAEVYAGRFRGNGSGVGELSH
jgi:hypothetical protein